MKKIPNIPKRNGIDKTVAIAKTIEPTLTIVGIIPLFGNSVPHEAQNFASSGFSVRLLVTVFLHEGHLLPLLATAFSLSIIAAGEEG